MYEVMFYACTVLMGGQKGDKYVHCKYTCLFSIFRKSLHPSRPSCEWTTFFSTKKIESKLLLQLNFVSRILEKKIKI